MAKRQDNEILYSTIRKFFQSCLLGDHSLLWPNLQCWTSDRLEEIKARMVDNPIWGDNLSFMDKLQKQMEGATQAHWAIICDIYYVYFMPSTFITFDKKYKDIAEAARMSGLVAPPENASIWEAQKHGFTRTGMKYHYKYAQFWLLIKFALSVKGSEDAVSIFQNHLLMQKVLDDCLETFEVGGRAYDMRHALLYMAFPDQYERSISTQDKKKIWDKYYGLIAPPWPNDLDEKLKLIREALSRSHRRDFDFYSDLKAEWRGKPSVPTGTVTVVTDQGTTVTVPVEEEEVTQTQPESTKDSSEHTELQWLLLRLGSDMGLDVWVARNDKGKEFRGQKFCDIPKLKSELPLKFDEITNKTIEMIDVVWMNGSAIVAAFEIESTTSIYSGLLRMADLISLQPNIKIPLYIVAPDDRRSRVMAEINRPIFSRLSPPMNQICRFIPFSRLKNDIATISPMIKYMKSTFIDEYAESCEPESDEAE